MQTERTPPRTFKFENPPHILIVEAAFHRDIAAHLLEGVKAVLKRVNATLEVIEVPGALEIPATIAYSVKGMNFDPTRRRYDGYVALGCVIRGDTMHDQIVGMESARGLQEAAMHFSLAIGNGILTVNNKEEALIRAKIDGHDRGGAAAEACLRMIEVKHRFHLSSKRRWVAR